MAGITPTGVENSPTSPSGHHTCARALVFTDLVGSTRLKQLLGDRAGTERILRHHREARAILADCGSGEEIGTAGDGMFLCFESPAVALRFALTLQRRLRDLWSDDPPSRRLRDRIGIHFGQVEVTWQPDGTKDLLGLEVDRANRVMSLATADQILLSQPAFDGARRAWTESLARGLGTLSWLSHGSRQLANLDEPEELFEVGETGLAHLTPPAVLAGASGAPNIAGWRPAAGELLPGSNWQLEQQLGGGPYEEVWRAVESPTGTRRVLRFCFRLDRLERLRQRRSLFERVQGLLGAHPHIAQLTAVVLDEPPFYVAYEFVPGRPLPDWLKQAGGAAMVAVKLELMAQLADALEAAHRAGIVHGDVKPGAVLVEEGADGGRPQVSLTRLGLGQVVADETLAAVKLLARQMAGVAGPAGPRLDGHFYLAPELLAGEEPSPQSDLYALGVLMYQLLVGDFRRPVTADWSAQLTDPLLREDLARCLAAAPAHRLATVGELAVRLRTLDQRRREEHGRERKAFLKGVLRTAVVSLVVVGFLGWQTYRAENQATRARAETARAETESQRAQTNERQAQQRLVRLQVALGESTQARGDGLGAALYQAEALRLTAEAKPRDAAGGNDEQLHRLRLAASLQQAPRLVQAWWFPTAPNQAVFRPGADQVLTAHSEGSARLLNLATGEPVQTFVHGAVVRDAGFLAGGTQVVTAGDDQMVRWWDVASGKKLREKRLGAPAQRLAVSPDNRWLAVATRERPALALFPADSPESGERTLGNLTEIFSVTFSPESAELAVGCDDGRVRRWSLPGLQELPALQHASGEFNSVVGVQYSPDGRHLLTASRDGSAGLWDRASGRRERYFWHDTWLTGASFSEDGARILTTSFDGTTCVWSPVASAATLALEPPAPGDRGFVLRLRHDHSVLQGTFSPDQRRIVSACFDHGAWLWNADTGDPIAQLKHGGFVQTVRFQADSRRVLTVARDGSMKLWDLAAMAADAPVSGVSGPDAPVIRTADGTRLLAAPSPGRVQLWDVTRWQPAGPAWVPPAEGRILALDRTGDRLAVLGPGPSLQIRNSRDGTVSGKTWNWKGAAMVQAACFLEQPEELLVVSTAPAGHFYWFPLEPDKTPREMAVRFGSEARIFLGADGQTVISTEVAGRGGPTLVRQRDAHTGEERGPAVECPDTAESTSTHAAVSQPGGWMLLTPADPSLNPRSALLIDSRTGRRVALPHDDGVVKGVFSPDGHLLATASEDGTARLWDRPGGQLMRVLSHRHQVLGLAFSDDGHLVATGSKDRSARVWDPATGEAVTPPLLHAAAVSDLWFTPGGSHLVTAQEPASSLIGVEVYRWPLIPTGQSPRDVKILAELLNSRTVEALGPAIPLRTDELRERWLDLSRRNPDLFTVNAEAKAAWHTAEARACAALKRWRAAAAQWDEVERCRPLTEGEEGDRQRARKRSVAPVTPSLSP